MLKIKMIYRYYKNTSKYEINGINNNNNNNNNNNSNNNNNDNNNNKSFHYRNMIMIMVTISTVIAITMIITVTMVTWLMKGREWEWKTLNWTRNCANIFVLRILLIMTITELIIIVIIKALIA